MKPDRWFNEAGTLLCAVLCVLFTLLIITLTCGKPATVSSINASEELARKNMKVREVESGTVGIRCFVLFNPNGTMVQAFSCAPQLPPPWQ